MIVNLIKTKQIFSVTLPDKVKGQYWISDIDEYGRNRNLISIEAVGNKWVVKSNKLISILNSENQPIPNTILTSMSFFNLQLCGLDEQAILFTESMEPGRRTFTKLVVNNAASFNIGRNSDNNFYFKNRFISGKHAKLSFNGDRWTIIDAGSTNGTFVNGFRVNSQNLFAGDLIFMMGLKIIIGSNYIAVNNPDNALIINSQSLLPYKAQTPDYGLEPIDELPEKNFFFRSPRFYSEISHEVINIDSPPTREKMDTVPLALMLGPSLTMGLASASTGAFTVNNVLSNGGNVVQAMPTLVMSGSMLLGTVMWPIISKKHEKKTKAKNEKKRQDKYLAYLDNLRDDIKQKCKMQSDILYRNMISIEECSNRIAERKPNLWERNPRHSDFLQLRLGLGNLPLDADVKCAEKHFTMDDDILQDAMFSLANEPKLLANVPISVKLKDDFLLGIFGLYSNSVNLLKSLILQLFSLHSYDEVKIMLITDEYSDKEWGFVRWIPHFWDDTKTFRFLATNTDEVNELSSFIEKNILIRPDSENVDTTTYIPYYVVVSTSKLLSEKCEALQHLLKYKNNAGFSIIMLAEELKDLPKEITSVIAARGQDSRMFDKDDTSGKGLSFSAEKVNENILPSLAEDLSNIELDLSSNRYNLPGMMTFLEMFKVSKIEHLNSLMRWKENNPTITLKTPIGVDSMGETFMLDLHQNFHGPHGLVAGMTGSGKSEFIITYILSLAVNYHPNEVAFILIDYKGGGLTGAFEDSERGVKLPHLAGTITNLDGASINRSLISIQSELRRRQAIFNEAKRIANEGTMDIYQYQQLYRDKVVTEPVPHLFIISDEFAELKTQQPEFMDQLISAARIGRSLGVHLILATQKPSGVVNDQIWSNSKFRVCLKVQEKADSQEMIKRPDAAELSQTGRFYLQVGFNELFALGQSAWCGAEYVPSDTVEKTVDSSIQVINHLGRVTMNVKPNKRTVITGSKIKQIVAIVKYLSDLAIEENIVERPLWLDPIPGYIYLQDLREKYSFNSEKFKLNPVVGEYDDPYNQRQGLLTVPFFDVGNCLLYGSTGNGKTTFLTTLCFDLISNYSAEELNLYIIDMGSETLKAFEKAPQVGGVVVSANEEKMVNLFKLLTNELDNRKAIFSDFGGDFISYCEKSGKEVPAILIALNNFAGFSEQYEDLIEIFNQLTRDSTKYGMYFIATAGGTGAVRYKTSQNFGFTLTLQLNDTSDYPVVVGKTDGLMPAKFKGRGLVKLDRVYEFQTAYCTDNENSLDYIKEYCETLRKSSETIAKPIPILPSVVNYDYVSSMITDLTAIPIGIAKKSLQITTINLSARVAYMVSSQDREQCVSFAEELIKIIPLFGETYLIDDESLVDNVPEGCIKVNGNYDNFVRSLFSETVNRNNTYKDADMNLSVLNTFSERVYVILGVKRFFERLDNDLTEQMKTLLEKTEPYYKLHFIFIDEAMLLNDFYYDAWFKKQLSGSEGLWLGDGVTEQYLMKISKITSELYQEIGDGFGYTINKNKPTLIKPLSSKITEENIS